ncbi:MAG: alpha/beta fold hydrolase [Paracoccaceae bacterium]
MPIKPEIIVDKLYDIALDPHKLETFIDVWTEAGLDKAEARQTVEAIDKFDEAHEEHLLRAATFLERGEANDAAAKDLGSILQPFEHLAAFIIDTSLKVSISNQGAEHFFGLRSSNHLDQAELPEDVKHLVREALNKSFSETDGTQFVVKAQDDVEGDPLVVQVRRLSARSADNCALALVVSTNYRWGVALGPTLGEVFGLTSAEQGIVRALVEGRNVKEIAENRGTSTGTVRGQLKSILSKMNARSQSEVIRLVINLQAVAHRDDVAQPTTQTSVTADWLDAEVWKPFKTIILPDGRRMDYHEMGPANGTPVLYSHMGYCMARWHPPMLKLAFSEGLRVICPIRAGFGHSDNIDPKADVLTTTREDTLYLMDYLGLKRLPYVVQGNDLVFAVDLAGKHPDRVSEIIGLGARPFLHGDIQFAGMSKWHRFFISTARHSPHLLRFTARAAVSLIRRIGVEAMFRNAHKSSAGDMAMDGNRQLADVLIANAELIASKTTDASQAYTMELIVTETPWDYLMFAAKDTKTRFFCGDTDPLMDISAIAAYRETYPWVDIKVIQKAGQMLIYQHFDRIIPELAEAARNARGPL